MYRDDREAADALAETLKRDNAELEDDKAALERENARLREELASRPAKQAAKKKPEATRKDKRRRQREARRRAYSKGRLYDWSVRIVVGLAVGVASFFITRSLYPIFNRGITSIWAPIVGAACNQMWGLMLISQPILGWWRSEDAVGGIERLSNKTRVGMIIGGVVAVAVTAAFTALVGEHRGD